MIISRARTPRWYKFWCSNPFYCGFSAPNGLKLGPDWAQSAQNELLSSKIDPRTSYFAEMDIETLCSDYRRNNAPIALCLFKVQVDRPNFGPVWAQSAQKISKHPEL